LHRRFRNASTTPIEPLGVGFSHFKFSEMAALLAKVASAAKPSRSNQSVHG
jgi:hypothetical protein